MFVWATPVVVAIDIWRSEEHTSELQSRLNLVCRLLLVKKKRLVQAEEAARRYKQELAIAASIQHRLMAVTIPEVPFARLSGRNLSCKEIGDAFYDAVNT